MNDDRRWQRVLARDARADGLFVTAVRSTGIYCRPSCPARHPLRKNVVFLPSPDSAERAGFRPCRRCRPREVDAQKQAVQTACRYIEAHLDERLTLAEVAGRVHLSPFHFQRTFKRLMGVSPRQYAAACREAAFKRGLKKESHVTRAVYTAGYGSPSRIYEHARLGMTPTAYRRGGQGMTIRYAIADSPLGRLLVAATEAGVCFVSLGDSDKALEAALRGDYHAAEIRRDDAGLEAHLAGVLQRLDGGSPHADLPLDIQGTAFQKQVWDALRAIPAGETRTYGEIARSIGRPAAARAVGHACGANPVAVVVPCHRAVGSGGRLTGYRWGLERKKKLLQIESRP